MTELNVPREWKDYLRHLGFAMGLEVVPWCLYSTNEFISGVTERLDFFTDPMSRDKPIFETNMYDGGRLYAVHCFLVEQIRIWGLSSDLADAHFELHIGRKVYQSGPGWLYGVRPFLRISPNLLIAPGAEMRCRLDWKERVRLKGIDGTASPIRRIQVVLCGKLARPVQ